jgi:hypothetical protein
MISTSLTLARISHRICFRHDYTRLSRYRSTDTLPGEVVRKDDSHAEERNQLLANLRLAMLLSSPDGRVAAVHLVCGLNRLAENAPGYSANLNGET